MIVPNSSVLVYRIVPSIFRKSKRFFLQILAFSLIIKYGITFLIRLMKFKRGATAWLISSLSRLKLIYFYSNSLPPPSPFNQSPDKTLPIDGHLHDTDTHLTSAPSMFMFKEN